MSGDSAAAVEAATIADSSKSVTATDGERDRRAILIGIGTYPAQRDSLPGPAADVAEMRAALINQFGFRSGEILTLVDRQGTRDAIIKTMRTELGKVGPKGLVFVYFSGHGLKLSKNFGAQDPENSGVDQALLVWDASGKSTMILDDELGVLMRELRATRRIVIVDACFSGSVITFSAASREHASVLKSRGADTGSAPAVTNALFIRKSRTIAIGTEPGFSLPPSFLDDGRASGISSEFGDVDDDLLISSAGETEESYGGRNWPSEGESHSVFTHTLTQLLPAFGSGVSFEQAVLATQSAIDTGRACAIKKKCQHPRVLGRNRQMSLTKAFAPP